MGTTIFNWFFACLSWMPVSILGMLVVCVLIKFGDAVLGLWDRAMRLLGR